jgi:hypothetical protein
MSSDTLEYWYGITPEMLKSMNNNNTKQSEETKIKWSMTGNPVLSGQSTTEAILTIHPDGRVTTSDRLKPDETAALVLDQIKTQWLKDAQATKIRELQDRIKRLEREVELFREYSDYGDVGVVDSILRGEEMERKEAKL